MSTLETQCPKHQQQTASISECHIDWAKADEVQGERLITENVTDVIKGKRYSQVVKPRVDYLDAPKVDKLLSYFFDYAPTHSGNQIE